MPNTHYALGCSTVAGLHLAFQDYLGLTGYLEYVAGSWIDVPGGFWIGGAVAVLSIAASGFLERRERRHRG
jgi:hypothetical protein